MTLPQIAALAIAAEFLPFVVVLVWTFRRVK
jgi:hypothetical protein